MKKCIAALTLALATAQPVAAQDVPASLELCLTRYRAGQAHYLATIRWTRAPTSRHLLLGARDTSNVVWVQRSHDAITGQRPVERVQFTVSDVSAYPLDFAIYDLTDAAYQDYRDACTSHQECYFGPNDSGVTLLTPQIGAASAAAMAEARQCPTD